MDVVPSLDPRSPRVRFGAELRRLREAAQLSQAAVAARLGCTQTQVSRLEKATRTPSKSDAERLDRLFGPSDGVSFTRLFQRTVTQPGGPLWFRGWVEEIEPTARILRSWDPLLIPGLLQTEVYARHLFSRPRRSPLPRWRSASRPACIARGSSTEITLRSFSCSSTRACCAARSAESN
ncbi:hypothetical protein GCM10012278_85500 [Nonomuraea glycinis]|uniref:HTH cro/C1-type domain-containing protein n=1 Tax=Nonomuraea glycinis TaxID=2047744 RepID=A0A918E9U1_9ACTN|nr:hypothetical protein GCM10012278_85500 [Nonomuraea glycinis]